MKQLPDRPEEEFFTEEEIEEELRGRELAEEDRWESKKERELEDN